jgi:glycosyltransferase involved in cell wall biosynthesis
MITELPVGGAQDNTLLTVEHLNKDKYDVTLMSSPGGAWVDRALSIPGIRVILNDRLQRRIHPISDLAAIWRIYRHLRRSQYDIVHTHSSKPGILGRIAARLAGVPVIVHTIHGFPFNDFMSVTTKCFYIFLEKIASLCADKLITVSNLNKKKAIELRLAKEDKFVNIYSGIDLSRFSTNSVVSGMRDELSIPRDHHVVGMVGRLSPQKDTFSFLEAVNIVRQDIPNITCLLVGDGELRPGLEKMTAELKLHETIRFLGERDDVPEILDVLDVFVLSSLWEGLGRALTEAMAMGKPVVATAVEGVPELVHDHQTGMLVQPKDPVAMAGAIRQILRDGAFARQLGQNAQKRVLRDFSFMTMIEKIDHLYDQLMDQRFHDRDQRDQNA